MAKIQKKVFLTFPAKLGSTVESVKALLKDIKTVREAEDVLRDLGFSKSEAQCFISVCKTPLRDSGEEEKNQGGGSNGKEEIKGDEILSELLEDLKSTNEKIEIDTILDSLKGINS